MRPKLEKLVLRITREERLDVRSVASMAVARASRGVKLKSVRIVILAKLVPMEVLELRNHVLHVKHDLWVDGDDFSNDDDDDGDERD
jgi:hypothetical protein